MKSGRKRKKDSPQPPGARSVDARLAVGALLDETIAIWQPRTSRRLTREDARQIVENMTGFFNVLREWDRAERAAAQGRAGTDPPITRSQDEDILDEAPSS